MNGIMALFASFALLLPAATASFGGGGESEGDRAADEQSAQLTPDDEKGVAGAPVSEIAGRDPWRIFLEARQPSRQEQVRIEQRIILRVTPMPGPVRQDMLAPMPGAPGAQSTPTPRFIERKLGSCVPMQGIASVGTGPDNRLILYMRDHRLVSAFLEKACTARQFYSGFLVERNEDGMLCIKRDKLQSRTGAKCELRQFRQLVALKD